MQSSPLTEPTFQATLWAGASEKIAMASATSADARSGYGSVVCRSISPPQGLRAR